MKLWRDAHKEVISSRGAWSTATYGIQAGHYTLLS